MQLPFFYIDPSLAEDDLIILEEDNSRHIVQVLRRRIGDKINLTDGKGNLLTATIADDHKKHCQVKVSGRKFLEKKTPFISIAISLLKNSSRFEWFLEKATEIGVDRFILLNCERTEKQRFRMDRLKGVCIAAMIQSEQCWLPQITEPVPCVDVKMWKCEEGINMIAHCEKDKKTSIRSLDPHPTKTQLIAIGPEGDFTPAEIQSALEEGFFPVSLGETRLRTETAGIVAASLLKYYK